LTRLQQEGDEALECSKCFQPIVKVTASQTATGYLHKGAGFDLDLAVRMGCFNDPKPAPVQTEDETTLPATDVCKHCLVRKALWPNSKCWHGEHEVPDGKLVPFSKADACWCQPFDGPIHPECPMHGNKDAELPPYDCTEDERVEWKSHWGRKLACRERQLRATIAERDALKADLDFFSRETMNFQINAGHRARQLADDLRTYDTVRADKSEAEVSTLKSQLDAVGQETPQDAWRRGYIAGHNVGTCLIVPEIISSAPPYTPPLKAGIHE